MYRYLCEVCNEEIHSKSESWIDLSEEAIAPSGRCGTVHYALHERCWAKFRALLRKNLTREET